MTSRSNGRLRADACAPLGLWLAAFVAAAVVAGCDEQRAPLVNQSWQDVCIDGDGDGFGFQCAPGGDCDDKDPGLHDGCGGCTKPGDGCACDADAEPVDCAVSLSVDASGALICKSGTRYCRDGHWSACEGVVTFSVAAGAARRVTSRALIDPNLAPEPCDPCHPGCFRVEDTMVTPPNYSLPTGLSLANGGGVTLTGEFPPPGLLDDAACAADDMPDCDGVPTAFDADPTHGAGGSGHRTLFMDLPPGTSQSQRVATRVFLSSADIYFYFDATSTMHDELLALVANFRGGNFLPGDGAGFDCVDANFDGSPDNEKKVQGVAGNIGCLVRDARFGAGWFREIPFYGPIASTGQAVAPWDMEMFEHRHDMTADLTSLSSTLNGFSTRANMNVPEGGVQGLWALATGGEIYAGWDRPGVPARTGCPTGTFGYPCFRNDALPIILHFTDAPMQEGPGTRTRMETSPATPANCLSDAEYHNQSVVCDPLHYEASVLSGMMSGSEGKYRALTTSAEDGAHAEPVGTIDGGLITYTGSTERMSADATYASLGGYVCPRANAWSPVDQSSPDALFRFHVDARDTYLISARGTRFDATLMLFELGGVGTPTRVVSCSDTEVDLHQPNERNYTPEIETDLTPGDYLVVLKGYRSASRGMFQLSFGRRSAQTSGSFQPKRWLGPLDDGVNGVREALRDHAIRVVTIQSGSDPYEREQANAIAAATGAGTSAAPLRGDVGNDVSLLGDEVVRVVRELALGAQMDVSLAVSPQGPAPMPPFGLRVEAVHALNDGCSAVADSDGDHIPDTHLDCTALARPEFNVTFSNGQGAAAVPRNPADPQGGYTMLLRVLGDERYLLDQVPAYLVPSDLVPDPVPPLRAATGSYEQEVNASGCGAGEGPIWRSLQFDAALPEGTRITFEICGGDSPAALDSCTFKEVANVVRADPCREQNDCGLDGYCDPSGFCHRVTGAGCESDEECGPFGTCAAGGGGTCTYARNTVALSDSTSSFSGRTRVRVRARLAASSDHTQAPTLLRWSIDYTCVGLE